MVSPSGESMSLNEAFEIVTTNTDVSPEPHSWQIPLL